MPSFDFNSDANAVEAVSTSKNFMVKDYLFKGEPNLNLQALADKGQSINVRLKSLHFNVVTLFSYSLKSSCTACQVLSGRPVVAVFALCFLVTFNLKRRGKRKSPTKVNLLFFANFLRSERKCRHLILILVDVTLLLI